MIVTSAAGPEDWRRKYFDSLRSLENEERQFRELERVLRRLVGRLCVAAQGQSARLDEELRKLADAIRRDAGADMLESLSPRLIAAVNETDHLAATQPALNARSTSLVEPATQPALNARSTSLMEPAAPAAQEPPAEAIFGDDRVRAVLVGLLAELRRDPELAAPVEALELKMAESLTREQLPVVLAEIADLVGRRVKNLEHAKREVEVLLAQMLSRLDEMTRYVAGQDADQTQQIENSATLNTQLAGEVKAIGDSVEAGTDLVLIRRQLRSRMDAIGRHLQEYRDRESQRVRASRDRTELMRVRVEQLESEARKLHEQLQDEQRLSMIDSLTQIPNRQAFEVRFQEELARFQRFGHPTCMALWDIDLFKAINDNYGHRAGDKVLKVVAENLANGIRTTDFLARYGGEEFVLLLPGTTIEEALHVMDTLRNGVARLGFHFRGTPVSVTISCGITQMREGDTAGDAFDRADKAMYEAKDSGRNRCVAA